MINIQQQLYKRISLIGRELLNGDPGRTEKFIQLSSGLTIRLEVLERGSVYDLLKISVSDPEGENFACKVKVHPRGNQFARVFAMSRGDQDLFGVSCGMNDPKLITELSVMLNEFLGYCFSDASKILEMVA